MAIQSIDEVLEDHKDKHLEIVAVSDFYIRYKPYYYRVIFEYTNYYGSKSYPTANISAEQLHKRYKVGARFFNKKQIGYSNDVSISSFEINNTNNLQIYKLKDVIDDNDIKIIDYEKTYEYFLEQNCYKIEYNEYDLIIPHYAIANHFHFQSSSLKNAILSEGIETLYVENTFKRDSKNPKKVTIKVNSKTNQSDLKTICNYITNEYAKKTSEYYNHQKFDCEDKYGRSQILSRFPILGTFNIKTLSRQINTIGKNKIIVLGIYQDDYIYDFNEIDYVINNSIGRRTTGIKEPSFTKEIPIFRSGRVVNKTPSSKYIINNEVFYEEDFGDINDIRLNPIFINGESNNPLNIVPIDTTVDNSFEEAAKDGNEGIQQQEESVNTPKEKKEIIIFNIEDFTTLFNNLTNNHKTSNSSISSKIALIPKKNDKNNITSQYYIMEGIVRCYYYGHFTYNRQRIAFVEIEAGGSWKKITTWFFILNKENPCFNENKANNLVFKYIVQNKKLEDIDKLLKEKYKILFLRKKHPESPLTNDSIKNWVSDVLSLLNKVI